MGEGGPASPGISGPLGWLRYLILLPGGLPGAPAGVTAARHPADAI